MAQKCDFKCFKDLLETVMQGKCRVDLFQMDSVKIKRFDE